MWFSFELFCLLWSWIFFMYFWAFWFLFFEIDYLCLFFWFSNESHSFSSWFVRGLNLMWIIAWNQLYVANILLYLCFIFLIYLLFSIAFWWTMEKAMAPYSSTLAWKIPWMEEPGRLQSMGSLESDTTERLHFHFSLLRIGERNGNPLQCSCLENPRDGGAWLAAVYGVAQSRTRLKWLSSSSSIWSVFHVHWEECVFYRWTGCFIGTY